MHLCYSSFEIIYFFSYISIVHGQEIISIHYSVYNAIQSRTKCYKASWNKSKFDFVLSFKKVIKEIYLAIAKTKKMHFQWQKRDGTHEEHWFVDSFCVKQISRFQLDRQTYLEHNSSSYQRLVELLCRTGTYHLLL